MNNERKLAVLRAGIVPPEQVKELTRWSNPELDVTHEIEPDLNKALVDIREAIESHETVELRTTDLNALQLYKDNQKWGRLYYSLKGGPKKLRTTFVPITYAKTPIGNYVIPWTDEDVFDLMLDPDTYLKPEGEPGVHFADVTELYYGEQKAFMICTPALEVTSGLDDNGENPGSW